MAAPALGAAPSGAMAAFNTEVAVDQLTEKGVAQGLRPTSQILASSFLGGAMLGWGGLLMTVVGGGCADLVAPGAVALLKGAVFPVGLSMITLSGSELFTGNMLTQALPPVGEERLHPAARVLGWSFVGNFAGSLVPIFNINSPFIFCVFLEVPNMMKIDRRSSGWSGRVGSSPRAEWSPRKPPL